VAASGVIITAGYILWTLQRVYLGAEYKGPHAEDITPMNAREATIAVTLLVMAVVLGVYPNLMFDVMNGSMAELVDGMGVGLQNAQLAEPAAALTSTP
jgi:NADH-quinone oxidoreductase subunit M